MSETGVIWLVTIVYIVLSISAGFIVSIRKRQNQNDLNGFLNSGRATPPLVTAFSVAAATASGIMFMGTPTQTYTFGWPFYVANLLTSVLGVFIAMLWLGRPMRCISEKLKSVTVIDFLAKFYNYKILARIGSIVVIVCSIIMCSIQWQCLGNLFAIFGADYSAGVLIGAIVVLLYLIFGGNESGAVVGAIQTIIAIVAVILMVSRILDVNDGLVNLNLTLNSVNPDLTRFNNNTYPMTRFVTLATASLISVMGQPYISVKYSQIKDSRLFSKALLLGIVSYLLMGSILIVGIGMRGAMESGLIDDLENVDSLIPVFISEFCMPWAKPFGAILGGIVVAAVLCAIMSTVTALVVMISGSFVQDILGDIFHVDISGKRGVRLSRIAMVASFVISIFMALKPVGTIFAIGFAAATAFSVVFAPSLTLGVRWRGATKYGALASMIVGLIDITLAVMNALGAINWPSSFDLGGTFIWISFAVFVIVSKITPKESKPYLPPTKQDVMKRVAQEQSVS